MNEYIGIPFRDGEPSFNGCNCITLIEFFYKNELNINLPKLRIPNKNSRRIFIEYLNQISTNYKKVDTPSKYNLVVMAYDKKHPDLIQHIGMYIGDGKMLHTLDKIGSHIVKIEEYKYYIKGYFQWQ